MPRRKKDVKLARRYRAVYEELFKDLPKWKREAIEDNDDRISSEFAKEVISLTEKEF